jgi:hypothetical protein
MQETNFHNSIKTFTIRVAVTATKNCMVIKTVYCLEYKRRARTPRSQLHGTQKTCIYTRKFINRKRFLGYTYTTNCTSTIKIKRTATQHYTSRMIHDNATSSVGHYTNDTPNTLSYRSSLQPPQPKRTTTKMEVTAL